MSKEYRRSVFIFRRDLRLEDNDGLNAAMLHSDEVIPIFILTPTQLDEDQNKYKSNNCVQFMIESLEDLDTELKLHKSRLFYFHGDNDDIIEEILKQKEKINLDAIFVNMDYTPFSNDRDSDIETLCEREGVAFHMFEDLLLQPAGSILTTGGDVYSKFTPYFNKAKKVTVNESIRLPKKPNFYSKYGNLDGEYKESLSKFYGNKKNPDLRVNGGRQNGLKRLSIVSKNQKNYNKTRNDLTKETTLLSAHIKFGTVSIREVYHEFRKSLGMSNDLIKQLYWRDFYHNIIYDNPEVLGHAMKPKYDKIKWKTNKSHLEAWKEGRTGFPIVDAGMREMNTTGFMHNRARLITSNFLIKILMIDWREGEQYFAQTLVDYDVANNNGNWQWGAGSGADSQPYFRIMNPWTQGEKHDKDAIYIKKWVPELKDVPAKHLHQWDKYHTEHKDKKLDYPSPIVDYKKNRESALKMYKSALD